MRIAVIPARAGSKRLPGKNLAPLHGKPLIAYSVQAAVESQLFDRVLVSTDSQGIADVGMSFGGEVDGLRPAILSGDDAASQDVIRHELATNPDAREVYLLQPTSPLRTSQHLRDVCQLKQQHNSPAVVSVKKVGQLGDELFFGSRSSSSGDPPRMEALDLGKKSIWQLNGAIYAIDTKVFLDENTFLPRQTIFYEMSERDSLDIDTHLDFEVARQILAPS